MLDSGMAGTDSGGLGTRLHEAGAEVEIIQEILRYSDPKITQDSYIMVKSSRQQKL